MRYYRNPTYLSSLLLAGSLTLITQQALASAFFLHEQSAALMGGFYAGSAAIAEDASTNWYNPAGLTQLEGGNFVMSATNISTQTEFTGTTQLKQGPFTLTETGEAGGGTARLVPAMHGAYRINKKWAVGMSVVTPYGLSTNYETDSIVRYNATESELKTIDISPSVAYQALDWLSFGIGFDAEYAEAKLDAVIGCIVPGFFNPVCGPTPTSADSISKNKASDWGYGWHAGALVVVPKTGTHLGLAFHSNIEQDLSGRSKLHGPLNAEGTESHVSSSVDLPWWLVGSITHEFNDKFTVLGSVEYVHWSSIQTLELDGVQTGNGTTATSIDDFYFEESWGFFGAVRYNALQNVMLTVGGGYENTPTTDENRDIRLPDANRWIASCGLRWVPQAMKRVQFDVSYAHLWGQEVDINKVLAADTQTVTAVGTDISQVNLIGAQITVKI